MSVIMKGGIHVGKIRKRSSFFLLLILVAFCLTPFQTQAKKEVVYIVPLESTVENGLHAFLKRAIATAEENDASAIIFHINTNGGVVDAASKIGKLFKDSSVKTVAWVDNKALSAGAFIALNADEIYMSPSSTMGAAAIIDSSGNAADQKAQSYWLSAMESAAENSGRDPQYAMAMADGNISIPDLKKDGELLTLTNNSAELVGYSEGTVENQEQLLSALGIENAEMRNIDETIADKVARFLTNPVVIPFLLTIGFLGLVMELFSPGFGISGIVGISSLLSFFYGHLVSGIAGYETLVLFLLGIFLLILEFFLPGGIAGSIGFISIVGSLFLATDNYKLMAVSLLIAVVVSLTVSILLIKVFGKKMKFFKKMILKDSTSTEEGYVSNVNRVELIGKIGISLTPLRPSGIALIDDERIDVVTEGNFIDPDKAIIVVKTEGSRIVVREHK